MELGLAGGVVVSVPAVEIPPQINPNTQLILSVSGGKDSTALALWAARESGLDNRFSLVFCDTGHEHPETLAHLEQLAEFLETPLITLRGPYSFIELAEAKGRFPSMHARFCTGELKVRPMARWLESEEMLEDPVLCVGVRAQESASRAALDAWQEDVTAYDCPVWRPILDWTHEEVFAIHRRHGFPINPLYAKNARRVGCFPCIFVGKTELRAAFQLDPGLLSRLRSYERRVRARAPESMACFFHPGKVPERYHDRVHQASGRSYASVDAVYHWALKALEGEPTDANEGAQGCMSQYGLCE